MFIFYFLVWCNVKFFHLVIHINIGKYNGEQSELCLFKQLLMQTCFVIFQLILVDKWRKGFSFFFSPTRSSNDDALRVREKHLIHF